LESAAFAMLKLTGRQANIFASADKIPSFAGTYGQKDNARQYNQIRADSRPLRAVALKQENGIMNNSNVPKPQLMKLVLESV
jgi:hypothetical protein